MTGLDELIERVRRATGPNREIDVALLHLWQPDHDALRTYDDSYQTEFRDGSFSVWKKGGGYSASVPFPRFTASVDAALALTERVLPGWMVVNLCEWDADVLRARGAWNCTLKKLGTQDDFTATKGACHHAPTAPLAILAALLSALHQEGKQ